MESGTLRMIVGKLHDSEPLSGLRTASVAVIIAGESQPAVLLIRRADREGDPWSGQVAFPGGKTQPEDKSSMETALREAREEVGIDLAEAGRFLGYFKTFRTHTGTMDVIPAVFSVESPPAVHLNEEASASKWVDLETFKAPETKGVYELKVMGRGAEFPAYRVDEFVVWGLTHRILSSLLEESLQVDSGS